jgi:hypothetical protein
MLSAVQNRYIRSVISVGLSNSANEVSSVVAGISAGSLCRRTKSFHRSITIDSSSSMRGFSQPPHRFRPLSGQFRRFRRARTTARRATPSSTCTANTPFLSPRRSHSAPLSPGCVQSRDRARGVVQTPSSSRHRCLLRHFCEGFALQSILYAAHTCVDRLSIWPTCVRMVLCICVS